MEKDRGNVECINYLIRKLVIISNDDQFHNYGLRYLEAKKDGNLLTNLVITKFERERAGFTFIDSMVLREESGGTFTIH